MNPTLWSSGASMGGDDIAKDAAAGFHEAEVNAVWACWVATFQPRRAMMDKVQRGIIKDALEVADADECCAAIRELYASDYHQKRDKYQGRAGNKYNNIRHALKGRPRRGESTRERIDWWLDMADERKAREEPKFDGADYADRAVREGLI